MVFPARFRRRSLADHTAQGAQSLPGGHGHSPAATVTAGRPALQPGVTRTVGSGEAAKPDPPRNRTHATRSPRRTLGVTCTLRLRPPSSRVPRPAVHRHPRAKQDVTQPCVQAQTSSLENQVSTSRLWTASRGPHGAPRGRVRQQLQEAGGRRSTRPVLWGHRHADGVLVSGLWLCVSSPALSRGVVSDGAALGAREVSLAPAGASRASANRPLRLRAGRLRMAQRVTRQRKRDHTTSHRGWLRAYCVPDSALDNETRQ